MKEKNLKEILEKYFVDNNILFKKDVGIRNDKIDFVFEKNEEKNLVIVRSNRAKLFTTVGGLINSKRTCSNVVLFAPSKFIKNFQQEMNHSIELNEIGLITMIKGSMIILKEPSSEKYYINEHYLSEGKPPYIKKNIVTQNDIHILTVFSGKVFLISDVARLLNIKLNLAQRKVMRLKKLALVEEVVSTYPKGFRALRIPEETSTINT
jgi:hypothetical protein